MIVKSFPNKLPVTQADLQNIVTLRNRAELTQMQLQRIEESVLVKLVNQAEVEPGVHHAFVEEIVKGRVRRQKLIVR